MKQPLFLLLGSALSCSATYAGAYYRCPDMISLIAKMRFGTLVFIFKISIRCTHLRKVIFFLIEGAS